MRRDIPIADTWRSLMSGGIAEAKSILKNVFGYDDFWPLQEAIIAHLLEKRNALVVLPTGGGKSLCYQIQALFYGDCRLSSLP